MPKTSSNATSDASSLAPSLQSLSYEQALAELEALVSRMESGQMPLDDLLSGYARGAQLLKTCRDKLAAVEQQIKQIDEKSALDASKGAQSAGQTREQGA
jgi:exodeoxyribonuclease VII small subunit